MTNDQKALDDYLAEIYKVHEFCLDKITLLDGQAILTGICSKMKGHEGAHVGKARQEAVRIQPEAKIEVEMVEY